MLIHCSPFHVRHPRSKGGAVQGHLALWNFYYDLVIVPNDFYPRPVVQDPGDPSGLFQVCEIVHPESSLVKASEYGQKGYVFDCFCMFLEQRPNNWMFL